jgi:hypothetical protein
VVDGGDTVEALRLVVERMKVIRMRSCLSNTQWRTSTSKTAGLKPCAGEGGGFAGSDVWHQVVWVCMQESYNPHVCEGRSRRSPLAARPETPPFAS